MNPKEDPRTDRYIAAIWRAVAKAMLQVDRSPPFERERMVQVAEAVEEQLRITARLYGRLEP